MGLKNKMVELKYVFIEYILIHICMTFFGYFQVSN
jgi:hypothetical protein